MLIYNDATYYQYKYAVANAVVVSESRSHSWHLYLHLRHPTAAGAGRLLWLPSSRQTLIVLAVDKISDTECHQTVSFNPSGTSI